MQENENEKKKVGFFGKIKNILFVEEDPEDEKETPILPDYKNRQEEIKEEVREVKEESSTIGSRFSNTRREFEEEIEETKIEEIKEDEVAPEVVKEEEKESPFFSFDEDEFKRLTSRVDRSEANNREKEKMEMPTMKSTYSSTPKYESRSNNLSSVSNTSHPGKKPFVPSPVISPVYGILDKNYSKEDIIDKRTERKPKDMDNLDRVRTKAFGNNKTIEEIEKEKVEIKDRVGREELEEPKKDKPITREERKKNEVVNEVEEIEDNIEIENPTLDNKVIDSIEDSYAAPIEEELNNMLNNEEDEELVDEEETNGIKKSAKLDDLEKTSTLKILDDIEKELNSIKPTKGDSTDEEDDDNKDGGTVEKDIFDMISSMYEGGDDEDDSD